MSVNEKMTAIADTIRSYTGKPGKLGLSDMPGAIDEAVAANGYDAGYSKGYEEGEASGYQNGYAEGNEDGIAEGKQAEYDHFWDAFQQNGNRTEYQHGFYGAGWTDETFKPKYDVITTNAEMMFRESAVKDFGKALNGKKIVFNTSVLQTTFYMTQAEIIDGLEFRQPLTSVNSCFYYAPNLREIRSVLPISENATNLDGFWQSPKIETLMFSGTIPIDLSVRLCTKLSKESIVNIVGVLSATATGKTLTLSKTAVESAFGSTTAAEWTALVATKSNWTISLV